MSSALKELFPTVKRRPRTLHIERGERTSASFLRVLSSKDKARGIAKRLPEAFVHFGSGTIKNYEHLRRAAYHVIQKAVGADLQFQQISVPGHVTVIDGASDNTRGGFTSGGWKDGIKKLLDKNFSYGRKADDRTGEVK